MAQPPGRRIEGPSLLQSGRLQRERKITATTNTKIKLQETVAIMNSAFSILGRRRVARTALLLSHQRIWTELSAMNNQDKAGGRERHNRKQQAETREESVAA
jgi:hypothetical protein